MLDTYIPGDCLPGLLDGWCGPAEYRYHRSEYGDQWDSAVVEKQGTIHKDYQTSEPGLWWHGDDDSTDLRLDLRREEVRDRVARVLAKVLRVPVGATAPKFAWHTALHGWLLGTGTLHTCRLFISSGTDADYLIPSLVSIPLDSPDRDALALAEIARWVGAEIRAGRIAP